MVGAEAFPAALRQEFAAKGIAALQCYGTADVGLIAYETLAPDGSLCQGMMLDEGVILEIVEPGSGRPVAPGEVGEVVVTTLTPEYPLIRFATGDLSALPRLLFAFVRWPLTTHLCELRVDFQAFPNLVRHIERNHVAFSQPGIVSISPR